MPAGRLQCPSVTYCLAGSHTSKIQKRFPCLHTTPRTDYKYHTPGAQLAVLLHLGMAQPYWS